MREIDAWVTYFIGGDPTTAVTFEKVVEVRYMFALCRFQGQDLCFEGLDGVR